MKAETIRELHALGVYRDPKTKQKLESMKLPNILEIYNWVMEEMEKGVVFERKQCDYEFVKPVSKQEKLALKTAKGKRR